LPKSRGQSVRFPRRGGKDARERESLLEPNGAVKERQHSSLKKRVGKGVERQLATGVEERGREREGGGELAHGKTGKKTNLDMALTKTA